MDSRRYAYTERMGRPATGQTPLRNFRAPDDEWSAFRLASGNKMSALIREFIRWYLRKPGAQLPERPSAERIAQINAESNSPN